MNNDIDSNVKKVVKFSTVIPMYNKQSTIRRALYSVLEQSTNVNCDEVIIIDDGSTDESVAVVVSIKQQFPNRSITLHHQANAGVSAARNKGVELAKNEYITFLDADDSYEPNYFKEINTLSNRFPEAAMLATGYRFVNVSEGSKRKANFVGLSVDDYQLLSDYFYSSAKGDLPVISSTACIKKDVLKSIGGFPVGESMGEDQAVWSQLALTTLVAISKKICANYFVDINNSLMHTEPATGEMPFSKRLQTQLDQHKIPTKFRSSVECYISGHLLDLVRRNIQSGNLVIANDLIKDKRTKVQYKRWSYWCAQVYARCLISLGGLVQEQNSNLH